MLNTFNEPAKIPIDIQEQVHALADRIAADSNCLQVLDDTVALLHADIDELNAIAEEQGRNYEH